MELVSKKWSIINCIPASRCMEEVDSASIPPDDDPNTRQLQQMRASLAAVNLFTSRYKRASRKKEMT
eukprot:scaffold65474_cov45-Attheya_sp.AAC.1